MAHRIFVDANGVEWEAWEVHPTLAERRSMRERRATARAGAERRRRVEQRTMVRPELAHGWLAFQSATERRRRAPIPDSWEELSDQELCEVLARAQRSGAPRRLIE